MRDFVDPLPDVDVYGNTRDTKIIERPEKIIETVKEPEKCNNYVKECNNNVKECKKRVKTEENIENMSQKVTHRKTLHTAEEREQIDHDHAMERANELIAYYKEFNELPKVDSDIISEASLGIWFMNYRRKELKGRADLGRTYSDITDLLRRELGEDFDPRAKRAAICARDLVDFYKINKRLPKFGENFNLAQWYNRYHRKYTEDPGYYPKVSKILIDAGILAPLPSVEPVESSIGYLAGKLSEPVEEPSEPIVEETITEPEEPEETTIDVPITIKKESIDGKRSITINLTINLTF